MTITTIKQLLTFKVRVLLKGNWQQRHCYREVRERGGLWRGLLEVGRQAMFLRDLTYVNSISRIRSLFLKLVGGNSSVVEHRLAKARVAGSNPVSRSIIP